MDMQHEQASVKAKGQRFGLFKWKWILQFWAKVSVGRILKTKLWELKLN